MRGTVKSASNLPLKRQWRERWCWMSLIIKNWKKFQHFKDRRPPWIKLYRDLLDDEEFYTLDPLAAKTLVLLWLLASEDETHAGILPPIKKIAFRLRMTENALESIISRLDHWVRRDDITMISPRYQDGPSETEAEAYELETDTPEPKSPKIQTPKEVPAMESREVVTVEQVVEAWNQIGLKQCKKASGPIRDRIKIRIREHPELVWFTDLFARCRTSTFLSGRSNVGFMASLDWVLGPKNLAKIEAGNFDDTKAPVIPLVAVGGKAYRPAPVVPTENIAEMPADFRALVDQAIGKRGLA